MDGVTDLTRPADAQPLSEDGGLHVLVLEEGQGDLPAKYSRCLVHYVGRLAESGQVFMDTRKESQGEEPAVLVAGRDSLLQEQGLHMAVSRLRCGGRARIWAAPQYGYGEKGSFSFPTVPPAAHLVYDLELLDFEPPNEGKERSAMTFEERVEAADRRRADGNSLYASGQFGEAISKYRLALSFLNEDLMIQLGDFHYAKAMDVKRPALLNIAACQLRQEDYHAAIATCSDVLKEEKRNAKALYRRGRARAALGQLEAAAADLEAARAASPRDAAVVRELAAVRAKLREERQASGRLFKGYFSKAASEHLYAEEPAAAAGGGGGAAAAAPEVQAASGRAEASSGAAQQERPGLLAHLRPAVVALAAVAGMAALMLPWLRGLLQPAAVGVSL